jgi:hypothetical protein
MNSNKNNEISKYVDNDATRKINKLNFQRKYDFARVVNCKIIKSRYGVSTPWPIPPCKNTLKKFALKIKRIAISVEFNSETFLLLR